MRQFLLAAAILSLACTEATAQTYRWVDKEGQIHYTDSPPPPDARNVQQKDFRSGGGAGTADLPYATQVAAANFPVTLYVSPDCGAPCDGVRALLVKRAVPFREISVTTQEKLDEVKKLSGNTQVPVVLVGKQVQTGFNAGGLDGLLDSAGYPSSAPPVPLDALREKEPAGNPPPSAQAPARPAGSSGYEAR